MYFRNLPLLSAIGLFLATTPYIVLAEEIPISIDYTMYKLATQMDDAAAQYFIGRKYLLGTEIAQDKLEAAKWLERAAAKEYTKAQYLLGKMYLYGDGVATQLTKAHDYLSQAASKNHAEAQYELANIYFFGHGGGKYPEKAVKWYRKAANNRHAKAQLQLGKILYAGIGVPRERKQGRKWLQLALDNGFSEAAEFLRTNPQQNRPAVKTTPNKTSTPSTPQRTSAEFNNTRREAKLGNVDAQYSLAMHYLQGKGTDKDIASAAKWFRKAAEKDHTGAQYQLGQLYENGDGVPRSESEAIKWFRLASSWGDNKAQAALETLLRKQILASENSFADNPELSHPSAQFTLGVMYADGNGVNQDLSTAAQWFLKAADQNHVDAQLRIGQMYQLGHGVEADPFKAKHWLSKAADNGNAKASEVLQKLLYEEKKMLLDKEVELLKTALAGNLDQTTAPEPLPGSLGAKGGDLEELYHKGLDLLSKTDLRDINQGLRWLQRAATRQHVPSQLKLGELYLKGLPKLGKDAFMARVWFKKAAQQNSAQAQFALGRMYHEGIGVKQDKSQALKWIKQAAAQHYGKASRWLEKHQ